MKLAIKILNEKHSRVTQELLFKNNIYWCDRDKRVLKINDKFIVGCFLEIEQYNSRISFNYSNRTLETDVFKILRLKELKEYLQNM